ncbi:MAG: hypothetical protein ABEJ68_06600 [Halobacteriaceae archaeon]
MYDRRTVLGAVGGAAATLLAGCGGSSDGTFAPPGEARTISGLRITVTDGLQRRQIDVAPDGDGNRTTRLTAGTSKLRNARQFVGVKLHIENATDEEQELPAPAPAPPLAAGKIAIESAAKPLSDVTPERYEGHLWVDGEPRQPLTEALAARDLLLAPEASVAGWVVFLVDEALDLSESPLAVEIEGVSVRFEIPVDDASTPG